MTDLGSHRLVDQRDARTEFQSALQTFLRSRRVPETSKGARPQTPQALFRQPLDMNWRASSSVHASSCIEVQNLGAYEARTTIAKCREVGSL